MEPRYNELDAAVIKRIGSVNIVLIDWMKHKDLAETTPERCYQRLVDAGIYPRAVNALRFRKDLRYLRDHNALDIFFNIRVYQTRNRLWHIELNSSSMTL